LGVAQTHVALTCPKQSFFFTQCYGHDPKGHNTTKTAVRGKVHEKNPFVRSKVFATNIPQFKDIVLEILEYVQLVYVSVLASRNQLTYPN